MLAYPNFDKSFRLSCDASRNGLGATLEQEQDDGKYRPIAFASRRTSAAEKNYPVHKLEFLALKWSVCEKFKDYVRTKPFVCYTDNNPLTYIFKSAKLDATAQRWVAQLEPYDFRVVYRPGSNNVVADALSRKYDSDDFNNTEQIQQWAAHQCEGFETEKTTHLAATTIQQTIDAYPTTNYDWKVLQSTDNNISTVKKSVIDSTSVSEDVLTPNMKTLLKVKDKLLVHNNLLYYRESKISTKRLVVPEAQQEEVTQLYHSFGHFGITRTYKMLKERFYWPTMKSTVIDVCSQCERCQKTKLPPTRNRGPLTHIITASKPMHQLSIDFLSIDTRAQQKCKILTCVDEFTKFAFAIIVKSENAVKTAEALYRNVYTKYGIPTIVHSDRGATFVGKILQEMNKILGIHHTTTTAYRPQSNGTCERLNSTIISRIITLHPREKQKWNLHIDSLIMAYNTTVHESIGISPFSAMFGRQPKTPLDLLVRLPETDTEQTTTVKSFANDRTKELKASYELMAKNIDSRRIRSKRNFDDKIKGAVPNFNKGDKVLVRKFVRKNKVDDRYQAEIHDVIGKKKDVPLYLVKGLESGTIKTIHRDHLILFKESTTTSTTQTLDEITNWDNMVHKVYERDPDQDYMIKKGLNQKVALHFGDVSLFKSDYKMVVDKSTTEHDNDSKLKTAREAKLASAIITITDTNVENIRSILQTIRREVANKNWTKIIIATSQHIIYNLLIEEMCTYFPKVEKVQQQEHFSESDDDSDIDYLQPNVQNIIDPEEQVANIDAQDSTTDDEDDQEPQPRYNLRRAGRRPPAAWKDYVTFTLLPQ